MFKFAAILVSRNALLTVLKKTKKKSSIGLMLYRPFFSFNFQASRGFLFQIFERRFVLKKSCDLIF